MGYFSGSPLMTQYHKGINQILIVYDDFFEAVNDIFVIIKNCDSVFFLILLLRI